MSAAFVIDCSVALTWLFDEEQTPATHALLDRLRFEAAAVPSLWYLEVTNIIALAERKGRVTRLKSDAFLAELGVLDIETDVIGSAEAFTRVLPLVRQYQLTSYDSLYLELSLRLNLPLATLDVQLRKVAASVGVPLLGI